jgi:hypothetical protein
MGGFWREQKEQRPDKGCIHTGKNAESAGIKKPRLHVALKKREYVFTV